MRICLIYDCLYPYTVGGAERWYRNLAERLAAEGHEVTYLTLRQWERGETLDLDPRIRVVCAGPRMALYTGGPPARRRILPPLVFGAGVLWHLLLHGRRYDAVHTCAFPYFSLLAAAAAHPLGRYRLVTDWFEVWSREYWHGYLGGLGGRFGALVQRMCARVRQHAFCFSELHAERLREQGLRGEVTLLRGLYAGSTTPAAPRPADPLVVFAGRLIPEKRVTIGAAAVAAAAREIPDLKAIFYGDGPEREALREAIAEHAAGEFISAPGFADSELIDTDMRRALCVLLPSEREGYGMVVIEACAHATPAVVVAAPDNAAVELVQPDVNGVIAASADPETIAQAIVQVHRAGLAMRQSTADWFAENAQNLSLESTLETVLAGYATPLASLPAR
ncbi:MAG TPA: glycosyltransferase [Solirubrobacteraceae bacterium]|jgi:glycosyltransferase involved in cell wall biosynthesis|nr:glycosyltransferase [Solirubrobacteraceae bacterium]